MRFFSKNLASPAVPLIFEAGRLQDQKAFPDIK